MQDLRRPAPFENSPTGKRRRGSSLERGISKEVARTPTPAGASRGDGEGGERGIFKAQTIVSETKKRGRRK